MSLLDLRIDSPTYKKWLDVHLSEDNRKMLYVPENFAHGYMTLTDGCRSILPGLAGIYAQGRGSASGGMILNLR